MNTCKTCKWWGEPVNDMIQRACQNPKLAEDGYDFSIHKRTLPAAIDSAHPSASDDFGICFFTGPSFGCIHHSPAIPATVRPQEV